MYQSTPENFEYNQDHRLLSKIERSLASNVGYLVSGSYGDIVLGLSVLREVEHQNHYILVKEQHVRLALKFGLEARRLVSIPEFLNTTVIHRALITNGRNLYKAPGNIFPLLPTLFPHIPELLYSGKLKHIDFIRYLIGSNVSGRLQGFPKSLPLESKIAEYRQSSVLISPIAHTISYESFPTIDEWLVLAQGLKELNYRCFFNLFGLNSESLERKVATYFPVVKNLPESIFDIESQYSCSIGVFSGLHSALAVHHANLDVISVINGKAMMCEGQTRQIQDQAGNKLSFEGLLSLINTYDKHMVSKRYHEIVYDDIYDLTQKIKDIIDVVSAT